MQCSKCGNDEMELLELVPLEVRKLVATTAQEEGEDDEPSDRPDDRGADRRPSARAAAPARAPAPVKDDERPLEDVVSDIAGDEYNGMVSIEPLLEGWERP